MNLKQTLNFASSLAKKVGDFIQAEADSFKIIHYKDKQDIVTSVDLKAEEIIIKSIQAKFPDHQIFSEEAGGNDQATGYLWIIDPLDGTKEFSRGIPLYNTCFALQKDGKPILSVVYRPTEKVLYSAAKNIGAFRNDQLVKLSTQKNLDESFIFAYLPTSKVIENQAKDKYDTLFKLSRKAYRLRGIAEESVALCWVGSGMIEATINLGPQSKWHDIVPGLFFAEEAGAIITDIYGKPIEKNNLSNGFVVSNGQIHQDIINITSQTSEAIS